MNIFKKVIKKRREEKIHMQKMLSMMSLEERIQYKVRKDKCTGIILTGIACILIASLLIPFYIEMMLISLSA